MAREIVRPDPATEARETARLQARRDRIRQYNEQSGGTQVDFRREPRQVLEQTKRQVQAVMDDPRYPNDRVRHEEAMKVAREGQQRHLSAVAEAERSYHAEVERLEDLANPPTRSRDIATMNHRQLLRAELEPGWRRSPGAIIREYEDALRRGDTLQASVYEDYARDFITDQSQKREFADLSHEQQRSRLPASAKTALEQMEGLVKDEYKILGGNAQQKHLMAGVVDNIRQGQTLAAQERTELRRNELRAQDGGAGG